MVVCHGWLETLSHSCVQIHRTAVLPKGAAGKAAGDTAAAPGPQVPPDTRTLTCSVAPPPGAASQPEISSAPRGAHTGMAAWQVACWRGITHMYRRAQESGAKRAR